MKSFFVVIFLLVPYLLLNLEGVTAMNMAQYDREMMSCCAEGYSETNSKDCCSKSGSNEPACGNSSCGEVNCNLSLQLKDLKRTIFFNFYKVDVSDKLCFGLKNRDITSVNLESIWNPPKFIS